MVQNDLTQTREDRRTLEDIHGKVDRLSENLRTELSKWTDHVLLTTAEPESGLEDERRIGSGTCGALTYRIALATEKQYCEFSRMHSRLSDSSLLRFQDWLRKKKKAEDEELA